MPLAGWRLSRLGFRLLGRPSGALAWPLGLAFLVANADDALAKDDVPWIEHCFSGLVDASGQPLLEDVHIDRGGLGYAALRLYELGGDQRYLRYAMDMGAALLALPRTSNGLIPYTRGRPEILVDTLAFVCPFLARLARMAERPDIAQVALKQLEATWTHGVGSAGAWVHHGFDATDLRPLGLAGWGRGAGWLLMALVDTVHELADGPDRHLWMERGQDCLLRFETSQRADGHWPWRLDRPEEIADSSVTSLVAYSLARWQRVRGIERPSFAPMLERCRSALDVVTDSAGRVGQCSGEAAGIGHYSTRFGHYLWAQAPAVAADRICDNAIEM